MDYSSRLTAVLLQDQMNLTDNQRLQILDRRQSYLLKLKPILQQRWQIYRMQIQSVPRSNDVDITGAEISKSRKVVSCAFNSPLQYRCPKIDVAVHKEQILCRRPMSWHRILELCLLSRG